MLAGLLVTPAVVAVIVGILSRSARAGLIGGALLLCAESAVLAYPHHGISQQCELAKSCESGVK
jgi:hypothetical protein